MAEVRIMVGGRQYAVHCRDGEEARLHELAGMMSERVQQVSNGSPGLTEVRQLLFAGLLLADSLSEKAPAPAPAAAAAQPAEPQDDPAMLDALGELAERIEALGDSLAAQLPNA
ncbi:MAG: cell division protein ZapA [Alphaproteobacteria bacterium]|nr:cell division protein ZapA [Alphaproteobacteria bacterium]MBU0793376.1 cell division protein ZapA [Alphaproteobacteria bacterium]MBU0877034.1 cell division protein ZapA [Alphaproteobacteria bacterium]MBU1768460.1 cell division protein ZapA [Alphaproteobacteria bacterium]